MVSFAFFLLAVACGPNFQTSALFEKANSGGKNSETPNDTIIEPTTKVEITYYWTVTPDLADLSTQKVDIYNSADTLIANVPQDLVDMICVEGSGFLPDGRLINVTDGNTWPATRFKVLDQESFPYGLDARGKALVPFKTIAVDTSKIKLGSKVFIQQFKGVRLPNGTVHDGCVTAGDIGGGIKGAHIDFFSGTYANYNTLNNALRLTEVDIVVNSQRCK